jgi:hypothetical protein
LERKRRLGHYAVIWRDGKPVAIGEDAPDHLTAPPSERSALKLRYESNDSTQEIKMIDSEILEKLQGASIEERILVIEAILRTIKNDVQSTPSQQISSEHHPLRGKVIRYDNPYGPVAASPKFESAVCPQRPAFGFMQDTGEILGDIVSPVLPH